VTQTTTPQSTPGTWVPPKSLWLELLGCEVRFRGNKFKTRTIEYGAGNPKTLILIHGVGGHAEAYSRNIKHLGEHFHTLAIDLPWHGLSGKPPFTPEMVPTHAAAVLDLMDSLGVKKAVVEGESLGGWVTTYLAIHHPDRLEAVILNTSAGIRWNEDEVKIDHAGGTNLLRERSLAAIANPNRETIRKRLEWLMASPDRVTDELVDLRTTLYTIPETQKSLTDVFAHSFGGSRSPNAIPEDEVKTIKVRALSLWSDKNPGAGPDAGRRLARLIPGAEFYCIKDAAHWPQWEQPEDHDRVVIDFINGKHVGSP
jgi:pimeloyl-ACP methyl ester carboxylesterase